MSANTGNAVSSSSSPLVYRIPTSQGDCTITLPQGMTYGDQQAVQGLFNAVASRHLGIPAQAELAAALGLGSQAVRPKQTAPPLYRPPSVCNGPGCPRSLYRDLEIQYLGKLGG